MNDTDDVSYRGHYLTGGALVTVESADGAQLGVLRHIVRHSPTGMGWGYGGSGPADLARSLLIDALGETARCPDCAGTGRVSYDPAAGEEPEATPYDPLRSTEEYEAAGLEVSTCWRHDCDGGYRRLPYQEFKWEVVAGLNRQWQMRRSEILAWLATRGQEPV